jgi:hypothetical protein
MTTADEPLPDEEPESQGTQVPEPVAPVEVPEPAIEDTPERA